MSPISDIKFRIAQAGCGSICHQWLPVWIARPDVEVVALVDIVPEHAEAVKAEYGLNAPVFRTLTEARAAVDFNLVCDTATPEAHAPLFHEALDLGCDVLSEKPLAETWSDAVGMVERAQRENKTFAVMQNRRYHKHIRSARELARQIGSIGYAGADFFVGPHFGGFRDIMAQPLLLDMAIHTFDQARFLLDADAVSVYCTAFNPPGSWYAGKASAVAVYEMDNGAVFCYRGSWCAEGMPLSWEGSWRIQGSLGAVMWDGANAPKAEIATGEMNFLRDRAELALPDEWNFSEWHAGCLTHMLDSMAKGQRPETHGADNIKSLAMVLAAIESAEQGKKVLLSDLK